MSKNKGKWIVCTPPGICGWCCCCLLKRVLGAASPLLPRLRVRGSVCQMAQQAGRPAARGAQEEIRAAAGGGGGGGKGGGYCHFKVCAQLSWSVWLCNRCIIIRGRPRPAECRPLTVWVCFYISTSAGGWGWIIESLLVDTAALAL